MVSWKSRESSALHSAALALLTLALFVTLLQSIHIRCQQVSINLSKLFSWELTTVLICFFPSVPLKRHLLCEGSKPSTEPFLGRDLVQPSYFFRVMYMLSDNWHFWKSLFSLVRNCSLFEALFLSCDTGSNPSASCHFLFRLLEQPRFPCSHSFLPSCYPSLCYSINL